MFKFYSVERAYKVCTVTIAEKGKFDYEKKYKSSDGDKG